MFRKLWLVLGICSAFVMCMTAPASAQVQEKPPRYVYVSNWVFPRSQWPKAVPGDSKQFDALIANGTINGYGYDANAVHTPDGWTHDNWWSSTSMAGLFDCLSALEKGNGAENSLLESATKHWDNVLESRYYDVKPGTVNSGYLYVSVYTLRKNAPDNAMDILGKGVVGPLMHKLFEEGIVSEWELDAQAIATNNPATFVIVWVLPNASGLDKTRAAMDAAFKANPLIGPTFESMVHLKDHRSELGSAYAVYK